MFALSILFLPHILPSPARSAMRSLTIDDVLDMTRIDRVALSPDGEWAAIVLQRPARAGEVYGRIAYEIDPARSDVWLVSLRTGARRNLTLGEEDAAGFWCATWSPDGSRLAMLSTRPEGGEPRGGDNVRLYLWDRAADTLTRMADAAMMTQTRYGSPLYQVDLRGGADDSASTHRCSDEENAPFLWLDDGRLLAVTLPAGGVAGLIDESVRPARHVQEVSQALREGVEPTVTAVGSGAERVPQAERTAYAELRTIEIGSGPAATIASVPIYPFRGELTLSVAPDGRQAAVLTAVGGIQPARGQRIPHLDETWLVEKRLGFATLSPGAPVRWVSMPPEAAYPLELFDWSPDGRRIAWRARGSFNETATPLFVADASDLSARRIGRETMSVGGAAAGSAYPRDTPVFWIDNRSLLVRVNPGDVATPSGHPARADWWRLTLRGAAVNVTAGQAEVPAGLRRFGEDEFFAVVNGDIQLLDISARRFDARSSADLDGAVHIAWPRDPRVVAPDVVVATNAADGAAYRLVSLRNMAGSTAGFSLPADAELLDVDPRNGVAISLERSGTGLNVRATSLRDGSRRDLLQANTHLAEVTWGERRLVEYRAEDGQTLKAAVILPPDYRDDRRYPVITWIYPGYEVNSLETYFLDPYLPGFYNLQLYAARNYVVLIPSIRYAPTESGGVLPDLSRDVLPAVDRLVAMGIADPGRVGVMGQSFGGFGTYALVTQTNRFRAAVAMAGDTDLGAFYSEFDRASRGYPGIEHEKSFNWVLAERGQIGLGVPPYEDRSLYSRHSPLAYVDRVETPLLMIHGEYDKRAPMSQAEAFFFSLYRQGKTARLLRYWGESHSLAQSPANVRSIYQEILTWFGRYLGPAAEPSTTN